MNVTLLFICCSLSRLGLSINVRRYKAKKTEKTYQITSDNSQICHRSVIKKPDLMKVHTAYNNVVVNEQAVIQYCVWCLSKDQQPAKEKVVKSVIRRFNEIIHGSSVIQESLVDQFGLYGFMPPLPQDPMPHWDFLPDLIETIEGQIRELKSVKTDQKKEVEHE